ncbi:glycosyltransferase family 9 protein [Desulfurispira natronophila]|uniref:Heptosyltransferase I n=1 Tax=Desulfurispira natronophila TaxID=682562 RepID=A0A7W7Y5R4_9BACT|nr:glycosyltransferase family 9 protein [Desulfurispira natronophila]MBB5022596.1 heptosyltransferase I [Desulfurispira natronophila]
MHLPHPSEIQSICILRLSALGDVCNLVPAVRFIQQQYPHIHITWVIGQAESNLLEGLEGVEFVVYAKKQGWQGLRSLRRQLAGRHFDILLHMQAALRASAVSLAIPARVRLGFDRDRAKDGQWMFSNCRIEPHSRSHVLEGFLDFVNRLGIDTKGPLCWNIPIPQSARESALKINGNHRPYMIVSPCSTQRTRNYRNWPAEKYAEVIRYAFQKWGLYTILTGGSSEVELEYAEMLQLLTPEPAIVNTIGKTDLKTLLALIDDAVTVIAPDSGPVHMATALETPAIGLYASSNPQRTGPYRSQQWVVNRYPDAVERYLGKEVSQVGWGERVRHPNVMDMISVAQVEERLNELLKVHELK